MANGWQKLRDKTPEIYTGKLSITELCKHLDVIFNGTKENPRIFKPPNIVHYTREDGVKMIRHEGPDVWGGAMTEAEWNKLLAGEFTKSFEPDKFIAGTDPYLIEHTREVTEITKIQKTGSLPLPNDNA